MAEAGNNSWLSPSPLRYCSSFAFSLPTSASRNSSLCLSQGQTACSSSSTGFTYCTNSTSFLSPVFLCLVKRTDFLCSQLIPPSILLQSYSI